METIFINTENRNTNEYHIFRVILAGKHDLENPNKRTFTG